ncbi:MFS transporter [Kurthia sibirica]|uniref:MFS transporter n=1 Tax=Kurthia sibirica TaxID=202750 RepID=A0A2U3AK95_9BACL|nr:MFS transporter [Kurthia sibirica]PWI24945.1 MFS transporter [Kurthia sibirica]GEK33144.1 putative MFS-type transporter YybF [Kurthia sibirica]
MATIKSGTKAFHFTTLALFAGAFSTYANLYMTQPVLPMIAKTFHVSPATASLSLSLTTLALAICMLLVSSLSEAWGRKNIMTFSMVAVALLTIAIAFAPSFGVLLTLRVIQGALFAGLPAIAMAYLGEEIEPTSLGIAMGLYISGNSIGGLAGRVIMGSVSDVFNWHIAMLVIGIISLIVSIAFYYLLPISQNFVKQKLALRPLLHSMGQHLKDPALLLLFGVGFILMGSFVTLYNYVSFLLIEPPFNLSQTLVGSIFIVYLVGTFSATWMGKLGDRHGKFTMLFIAMLLMIGGAMLTLFAYIPIILLGIALFTFGFFGGHAIASSLVSNRATHDKAQAASLYLFFYYVGSSIGGTIGGYFFMHNGWFGVIAMIIILLSIGVLLNFILRSVMKKEFRVNRFN